MNKEVSDQFSFSFKNNPWFTMQMILDVLFLYSQEYSFVL